MNGPRIVISIVSHQQGGLVRDLLLDLAAQCKADVRLVLTLNVPEVLPINVSDYPLPIELIRNERPKGFGANHNQAFQRVSGDYFCVVNPDIRLIDDPFDKLVACLLESGASLAAPVVTNPQGQIEDSARRFPTPIRILGKAIGLSRPTDYEPSSRPFNPDWAGGMFMLFQWAAFQEVSGFDERFFLYYEDVDLCARLRLSGHDIVVCPSVRVTHAARRASHQDLRYLKWHFASITRFFCSLVFLKLAIRGLLSSRSVTS